MNAPAQKPSIGRIVHYWDADSTDAHAAIITHAWNETLVNLTVFYDGAVPKPVARVEFALALGVGVTTKPRWDWPPRL